MSGTATRDAVVAHMKENISKPLTADEIAKALNMNSKSVAQSMYKLAARAVLVGRRREHARGAIEYSAGRRFNIALKSVGKKMMKRSRASPQPQNAVNKHNGSAIPAVAGGLGIVVKIDGTAHAITLAAARALYNDLQALFGKG